MTTVSFFVAGTAAPQGSKRHVGNGVMIEMSKNLPRWRKAVAWEATAALGHTVRLTEPYTSARVTLGFVLVRPKAHYRTNGEINPRFVDAKPTTRPDLDKLTRAVFDGLTQGGLLEDDARVHTLIASKVYVNPNLPAYAQPGCWVVIEP